MDHGERIAPDGSCLALDDFPSLRMRVRVERLGRSAHVALGFKLSEALRQHYVASLASMRTTSLPTSPPVADAAVTRALTVTVVVPTDLTHI